MAWLRSGRMPTKTDVAMEGAAALADGCPDGAWASVQAATRDLATLKQRDSVPRSFSSTLEDGEATASEISETMSSLAFSIIFFSRKESGLWRLRKYRLFRTVAMSKSVPDFIRLRCSL